MKYKLMLVDENSTILREWNLGFGKDNEDIDVLIPLRKFGPTALADDINETIAGREEI